MATGSTLASPRRVSPAPRMTPLNSVLIVDDEPAVRDLMARWVSSLGLHPRTAASADEAIATLRTEHYDLAVIDVMMPGHDGLWLANELRRHHPHTAVVMATGYSEALGGRDEQPAVADFLIKPFQRDRFNLALDRGRQWRQAALDELRWHATLSIELTDRTAEICSELGRLVRRTNAIDALTKLATERIPSVMAHAERVARFALSVSRELGLDADISADLELAGRFHDVGKAAIPDALLTKPSPLTPGEAAIARRHVNAGADILESMGTLRALAPITLATHEWFNGGGYPGTLSGQDIPLASRIIAVADAYDAMTQPRRFEVRLDAADAVAELIRCQHTQFDPAIVAAFLTVLSRH